MLCQRHHVTASFHSIEEPHLSQNQPTRRADHEEERRRLNAAARCMAVYQQGLLTLQKVRRNGPQRIMVQYVNVSNGGQAVVGNIEKDK